MADQRFDEDEEIEGRIRTLEYAEELARRDDHDPGAAIERLISVWNRESPKWLREFEQEFLRSDEFVCRSCWLILHRSQFADTDRGLCRDCAKNPVEAKR